MRELIEPRDGARPRALNGWGPLTVLALSALATTHPASAQYRETHGVERRGPEAAQPAGLTTVPGCASELVCSSDVLSGNGARDFTFNAPGAGTLDVSLTDLDWPNSLQTLSVSVTNALNVMDVLNAENPASSTQSATFQVNAGPYTAHLLFDTEGGFDLGAYSLTVAFQPLGAPVPLPMSGWLLLSGLAAGEFLRRVCRVDHASANQIGAEPNAQPN
jgi:hypothetical protein